MSNTVENTAKSVPEIGIVDLQNVIQIIDAAAERGAFKGNELTSVGVVRDRIDAFVKAVSPTTAENEQPITSEEVEPVVKSDVPTKKKSKKV